MLVAAALGVTAMSRAAVAAPGRPPTQVLVVAVPDLRWTDVATMPTLQALMDRGAVGVLSVRSEGESTRCGDGLLELSAGTRVPSGVSSCHIDPTTLDELRARYRHSRYGAELGLLGAHLGTTAIGVGPVAGIVAATSIGPAPTATSLKSAFATGAGVVVTAPTQLYDDTDRAAGAAAVDRELASTLRAMPDGDVVIVAGISDGPRGGPHLHPVVIAGPGWPHRALVSPTTGRAPYVQLFDLTATLLSLSGRTDLPDGMSGRAVRASSTHVRPASSYVDLDRHARRALTVGHPTFSALCGTLLGVMLLALLRPSIAVPLLRLLVAAPLATWLLQLVPWWRWSIAAYVALLVALCLTGAAVTWAASKRSRIAAVLTVPVLTAAVLLADQVVGARLQMSAPFGDNPLVAGRFHGMGNIAFGVTMAALLLCLGVSATGRPRRTAAEIVGAGGLVALVIDGAPSIGDDIGGILALVPAIAVLFALVLGLRLTARRVIPVVVATGVVALGAALVDYARPEEHRTHAGRFVADVVHGDAWRTVHRKLDSVIGSFATPAVTALVVVTVVLVVLASRSRLPVHLAYVPGVAAAATALAVLAVLGSALNDSGIFVAAGALLAFVPAALASSLSDTGRL